MVPPSRARTLAAAHISLHINPLHTRLYTAVPPSCNTHLKSCDPHLCARSILDSEAEDKRGFLLEWTEDGYYSAVVQVDGGDSGGDETRGGNENNDKEGDNDEGQGEDADDEAAGAGNKKAGEEAVPPKSIVQDGARLIDDGYGGTTPLVWAQDLCDTYCRFSKPRDVSGGIRRWGHQEILVCRP